MLKFAYYQMTRTAMCIEPYIAHQLRNVPELPKNHWCVGKVPTVVASLYVPEINIFLRAFNLGQV